MTVEAPPARLARVRAWFTTHHIAQLALVVHPLIVVRTGGEYLRLRWAGSADLPALIEPLFISLAAVGALAILNLILYFNRREGWVIALTAVGIAALVAYKLAAMPSLG
ncbi:MAG: hypothetical protein ABI697_12060 [Devosia sp.]